MKPSSKNFENEYKSNLKERWGVRHTMALLCFLGFVTIFSLRTCLSVAIVAMVSSYNVVKDETSIDSEFFNGSFYNNIQYNEEFNWDKKTVGIILGSFYYGYVAIMPFGGRIADYCGGYYPFGIATLVSSIITVLCPFAARKSFKLLIALKIIHGVSDAFGYPALYQIIAKWYPSEERSKFVSFIHSGGSLGIVLSMMISGWLSSIDFLEGWPMIFYFFGSFGILWSFLWFVLIYAEPEDHPRIHDDELKYILKECPNLKDRIPVPWKAIFTSKYLWVIIIAHLGHNWTLYLSILQLPKYFDDILHIDIKSNGLYASLPFVGCWFVATGFGYTANYFSARKVISILTVRKIAMIIGGYSELIGFMILSQLKGNLPVILPIYIVMVSLSGTRTSGYICSYADITPRFAGTFIGIGNTFGNFSGFLTALISGLLLQYYETIFAWKISFTIAAIIAGVSTTIYILFITVEVQPWNDPELNDNGEDAHAIEQNNVDQKKNKHDEDTRL